MLIRAKLVIIYFISIVVPMFLLWARWQGTAVGSIQSVMRQGLADRAGEISDHVTVTVETHQKQVLDLTRQPALRSYARSLAQNNRTLPEINLRNDLGRFLIAEKDMYAALIGVDRQGAPVFKITPGQSTQGVMSAYFEDKNFTGEDVLRTPEALTTTRPDSVFISEIQQDANGPHLRMVAPLRDDSNNPVGALVVQMRADQLLTEAAGPRITTPNGQAIITRPQPIILSPQGSVLYAAETARQWKPFGEAFPEFGQVFTSLLREKDKDADWEPWLVRHKLREASPQLSIFVVENYRDAIGSLEFDSYVLLFLTFMLVLVAMLALFYLISSTTDSIRRVTKGAKAIATGNLAYQIKVTTKDETRVLAEAFNRMASRLKDMIRKEGEQKQFESFAKLSAVLTHDLKNQILSLSLLVSNMERKFDREGFREDAMRTLSDSVNNLQNLVAKLSDPRTPTKRIRDRSNLTHLVERVVQRTAGQATNRFRVSAQLTPDLYAVVDGKAVERVIENLVINAIEAMPEGGSLRIETRVENDNAVVAIADSGKGMTEEFMRERLFHPFATTKKKGIGLGLYSCRDIIEQHGGRIDVASKVDVGTEFKIVLPLQAVESKSGELKMAAV